MAKKVLKGGLVHIIRDQIGSPTQEPYHTGFLCTCIAQWCYRGGEDYTVPRVRGGDQRSKQGTKEEQCIWVLSFPPFLWHHYRGTRPDTFIISGLVQYSKLYSHPIDVSLTLLSVGWTQSKGFYMRIFPETHFPQQLDKIAFLNSPGRVLKRLYFFYFII